MAAKAGAAFLGYIFYAPSKRFIAPRNAAAIIRKIRQELPHVRHVGVFVDDEPENIAWVRNMAGLDFVQLHGRETPEYCAELALLGIDIIKAIGINGSEAILDASTYDVPYYLCDTHDEKLKGGTGRVFDHEGATLPCDPSRLFLAGGLNPDNIGEVLGRVSPYAVDVSTGVEVAPGIKSPKKIKAFIDAVRNAATSDATTERLS